MSRIDSLLLNVLARFGVDPTAGDLAAGDPADGDPADETGPGGSPGTAAALFSPYRAASTAWGVAELPPPAVGRRVSPFAEETSVERRRPLASGGGAPCRRPRRSRRSRRLEVTGLPRPRGLLT